MEAVTSTTEFNVGQDYILFAETGDSFDEAISIIAESTRFRGSGDDNLPGVDKITLGSINSFDVSANPTIDAASGIAEAIVYIPGTEEELEDIENEFVTFKLLDGSGAELSVAPIDIDRTKIKGGVAMVEFVVPNRRIQNGQTPRYQIKAEWRGDTIKSSTLKVIPGPPENIQFSGYVIKDGSRTDLSTVSDVSRYRDGMFSTTTSYVVIQGAVTDAVGNPVANGTPVEWGAFGTLSDSKFYTDLPENTETVDGRVWTRIAVNDIPPTTTISLNSDATEGRFPLFSGTYTIDLEAATNGYLWNTVTQTPQIDLQSPDAIWVTAYVRDRFGNSVPDNTPVTWKDSIGMIWSAEQVTLNGQARAKVEFALHGLLADASALGKDWITASVGPTNAMIAVDIIDSRPISLSLSRSMIGRIPDDATEIGPIDGFRSAKLKLQSSTLSPLENNFSQVEQDVVISEGAWLNVSGLEPGGSYRIRLENNGLGWVSLARNVNPGGGAYWQNLSSTSTFEFYAPANGRKSIRIDTTHINLPPLTDLQSRNKPISVRYVLEREGFIVNNSWSRVAAVGGGAGGITVASDLGVATRMKQAMLVYFDAYAGGLLGSDDLGAGLLGDVGISLIPVVGVYSDIRDLGKQLFRGAANAVGVNSFSRFSKIDAVIAAAGILTELPPLQPLDYVLDAMRVSRKLIKTAPIFAPLATLLEPLFLRVVEGLWDAYFQGNVPPNGGGYGSISAAGFGGANPINAMGAGAGRGTVDDIGVMIDRFLSGKLKAGDKESLIGWVKTLKATATGVLTGNRSLYDSLTALMRTIESGKVAKSLDHLVAKFGKENESLMEIIVKARAKAGNDEDFARGIVALAKSLETPKALKSKLSSVEKAAATRKINEFAKTLANDPELAAAIVFKLGKIENNAANVAGQGHRVISISLGEALGSAIATGTLASTKSMDEFTNDLAFLFDRLRTNPSDTSNKILLKKINDNFKAMAAPGAPQSRQGVIQGRALELSGIAALVRKHNQDLVLNREILNYPTHLQPTDADIFSKLISRGSTVIGAESKFSKAALVSARSFARKVIAYKRELGDHGIFYLVVPAPAGLWQQAVEKLTQRRAQLHGNATEAHYIDEALRYLTKVSDKSRATGLGGEMTVGRLY